jgi:mRNA-degrading endonuclease RelE of RelBE toxin-antitoxin system
MPTQVIIQESFLVSAYELPKEITKKVFKALRSLVENRVNSGLNKEKLTGKASDLWSARVDDDYRIIFGQPQSGPPLILFVGKHDVAYRFADQHSLACARYLTGRAQLVGSESTLSQFSAIGSVLGVLKSQFSATPTEICAPFDDLEHLVTTQKYLPLARTLISTARSERDMTFSEIEKIIGLSLPPSATMYLPGVVHREAD